MSLKEQLFLDLKQSMKEKDKVRKNTVQSVRAAILQVEKDEQITLSEDDVLKVIASQLKKRKSALPDYEQSGRTELINELKEEIEILTAYLPKQLSEDEIKSIVSETAKEINATSMKDMGKLMGAVISKVGGKADNSIVSQIVKAILT
jgi:uncharacterized protein YqeY